MLKKRDEAYSLLGQGCSLADVARKIGVDYHVLQRCWTTHDMDPVRSVGRRLKKAQKRLSRAEWHHQRMNPPDLQSLRELTAALASVAQLEELAKQAATDEPERDFKTGQLLSPPGLTAYLDSVVEAAAADRKVSGTSRMLAMCNMLNDRDDGSHIAELVWQMLHDRSLLNACMKLSLTEKEIHPRAQLGERLTN
jgi:hypothetical protein